MTRRKLIRILIPLVVALIATVAVAKLTARPQAPTVAIVVAAQDIAPGTVLTSHDLQVHSVPASHALQGSLQSVGAATGEVARVGLTAGDPVLSDELQTSQMAGLNYQIPAGERAFTVPVNGVTGVGGSLIVGDQVDVLATFPAQTNTSGASTPAHASVVVQDVAVLELGTGTGTINPTAAGNGSPYTLVTLAVTPQEAAMISLSEELGSVTFLLRPHANAGSGAANISAGGLP
ncbi:MAG: Flp pilus assembly protein CpaB [Thermaerobacter sp.]|nr:Flp pilus assembly protein CpaB [Thermaerobacter sp.]